MTSEPDQLLCPPVRFWLGFPSKSLPPLSSWALSSRGEEAGGIRRGAVVCGAARLGAETFCVAWCDKCGAVWQGEGLVVVCVHAYIRAVARGVCECVHA